MAAVKRRRGLVAQVISAHRLKTARWPIKKLKAYERNAKKHPPEQIEKLCKLIERHGFDVPIVVQPDGVIIKGHGRWLAARKLGYVDVPVIIRDDLTPAQVREARLADNTVAETGWDLELLKQELTFELPEDFDVSLTGFDLGALFKADEGAGVIDGRMTDEGLEEWAEAGIKQVVLSFQSDEYARVVSQLDKLMEAFGVDSYTGVVLELLRRYA